MQYLRKKSIFKKSLWPIYEKITVDIISNKSSFSLQKFNELIKLIISPICNTNKMKQRVFNKKHMDVLFNWFYSMYVCMTGLILFSFLYMYLMTELITCISHRFKIIFTLNLSNKYRCCLIVLLKRLLYHSECLYFL